jgi:hypothetical protein
MTTGTEVTNLELSPARDRQATYWSRAAGGGFIQRVNRLDTGKAALRAAFPRSDTCPLQQPLPPPCGVDGPELALHRPGRVLG